MSKSVSKLKKNLNDFKNTKIINKQISNRKFYDYFQGWQDPTMNWNSHPFLLAKRPFNLAETNAGIKGLFGTVTHGWGSNPAFWGSQSQLRQGEEAKSYRPNFQDDTGLTSLSYKWQSNPKFWGKKNYWFARGRRDEKEQNVVKFRGEHPKNLLQGIPTNLEGLSPEVVQWWNIRGRRGISDDDASKFHQTNEEFWGSRGKRSQPTTKELKRESDKIPYWYVRGKRTEEFPIEEEVQSDEHRENSDAQHTTTNQKLFEFMTRTLPQHNQVNQLQPKNEFFRDQRESNRQERDIDMILVRTPNGFIIPRGK